MSKLPARRSGFLQRRELAGAFIATAAGTALLANRSEAQTCTPPCYPQTPAEIAARVTPTNLSYVEGDIRRYGATSTGNNSTAINNALLVSANGGNATFLPGGSWGYTSTLNATGSCSMYGVGQASILAPSGCDGITFAPQGAYEGSRFFRDFTIVGPNPAASGHNGITINLASGRVTGIQFSNLTIQNFSCAVYLTGAYGIWNSAFRDCFLYNNYQGYYLNGQAILLQIDGGFVQTGSMTGSGTRYGLYTNLSGGIQPQSLHVTGAGIYGYDINVCINDGFYIAIENCDLSVYNGQGVQIGEVQGNVVVRDCWIQAATAASSIIGVNIIDLGLAAPQKIVIDGCALWGNNSSGSVGVYCGQNQTGITLTNNTIGMSSYPFVTGISGISGANSANLIAKFNSIYASATAISMYVNCANAEIGPNSILSGAPLTFSGGTPSGLRYYVPGMQGTATFSASTSVSVTLPTVMPSASYVVSLGGNAAGYVWVTGKTSTGFIIHCSTSNSNATDWAVNL